VTQFPQQIKTFVAQITTRYDPEPKHSEQVARLSLKLFHALKSLHQLDDTDQHVLETAALLHDIGWSRDGSKGHHKHSKDMILELDIPGQDESEKIICALTARYHRKAEPDACRHSLFARLGNTDRNRVEWLAALLRIADGLDRSHTGVIHRIDCRILPERLIFLLSARRSCDLEIWGAERKVGLLEKKCGKKVVFESK